tara:strand:+ start:4605 stop:5003 length:399 start_codon:yes stop_codon:yes gene_type:complete
MNKFFVPNKVYEDRMAICKGCVYYFSLTGQCKRCMCFMKIKSRISSQSCPEKFWEKTSEVEIVDDLPKEMIEEVLQLWPDLKTGRAKNQAAKKKMIELYNAIHNASYNNRTNCGSCIDACFQGIKRLYNKYK